VNQYQVFYTVMEVRSTWVEADSPDEARRIVENVEGGWDSEYEETVGGEHVERIYMESSDGEVGEVDEWDPTPLVRWVPNPDAPRPRQEGTP
jgi:hypothetical protein